MCPPRGSSSLHKRHCPNNLGCIVFKGIGTESDVNLARCEEGFFLLFSLHQSKSAGLEGLRAGFFQPAEVDVVITSGVWVHRLDGAQSCIGLWVFEASGPSWSRMSWRRVLVISFWLFISSMVCSSCRMQSSGERAGRSWDILRGKAIVEWKSWGKGLLEHDCTEVEESDETPKQPMVGLAWGVSSLEWSFPTVRSTVSLG